MELALPKEPGYYWRRGLNHHDEIVEQVVRVEQLVSWDPSLFYWEPGELGAICIQPDSNVIWKGPVPDMQDLQYLEDQLNEIVALCQSNDISLEEGLLSAFQTLIERRSQ